MAKKVVATLKREASEQEKVIKVIRAKRSEKTGAYTFREEFVRADKVKDYFSKKYFEIFKERLSKTEGLFC